MLQSIQPDRRAVWLCFAAATLLAGCSSNDGRSSSASCLPGEARDCTCPGGAPSSQTCAEDGESYEACICEGLGEVPDAAASDVSVDGIDGASADTAPPEDAYTDTGAGDDTGGSDGSDGVDGGDAADGSTAFPVAVVSATVVSFQQVAAGSTVTETISVANMGSAGLSITSIAFQGHPDFRLTIDGVEYEPSNGLIALTPLISIPPNDVEILTVAFSPTTGGAAEGTLRLYTSDPQYPSGIPITLQANTEGPAVEAKPANLQFGGQMVEETAILPVAIQSVGTADLVVTGVVLGAGSDPSFSLDFSAVPGDFASGPSVGNPLVIPVNTKVTVKVTYTPSAESPAGEDGLPVLDIGTLVVSSNAVGDDLEVPISGAGVTTPSPVAVGIIQEGYEVHPQALLHLFGDQSFAPSGAVASWHWSVEQPDGSESIFIPSAQFPNPTFEVNVAGEYVFRLDVYDSNGQKSAVPWEQKVVVVPDAAIHVELLWHTPNDIDESDAGPEAGSDLDLHFAHLEMANSGPDLDGDGKPDPWFDQPFDAFWFNAHPNWGSFDPSVDDDPGLDRDDTDGAGPENLNLHIPQNTTYGIGVHYWSDHEYGDSAATVRIYIHGDLVWQTPQVWLKNHDMWYVAQLEWPSGAVVPMKTDEDEWHITPGYQTPYFGQ